MLWAQSSKALAYIVYADGGEFDVIRNNQARTYDIAADDVSGLELYVGDIIQTEKKTFLEIQIQNSQNVLKIAENTIFQISNIEAQGGGNFSVTYGRVRAKVTKLVGGEKFRITGGNAVAGVRGTDFGYDLIVAQGAVSTNAVTNVYCFEGTVEVTKAAKTPEPSEQARKPVGKVEVQGAGETIVISANEMVSLSSAEPDKPLEKESITEEVAMFWTVNDFKVEPEVLEAPKQETPKIEEQAAGKTVTEKPKTAAPTEEKQADVVQKTAKPAQKTEAPKDIIKQEEYMPVTKTGLFIQGGVLLGVGAIAETAGLLLSLGGAALFPDVDPLLRDTLGLSLAIAGGISISGSLVSFIWGALLPPDKE